MPPQLIFRGPDRPLTRGGPESLVESRVVFGEVRECVRDGEVCDQCW
jgi:hypothetical protein